MQLNKYDLNWCVRRLPNELRKLMKKEEIVVGGGYIRASIAGEPINDIDLFVHSKEYAEDLTEDLKKKRKPIVTDNAITILGHKYTIQFITRWTYDNPNDVIASFDFTICQAVFWWCHYTQRWCSRCSDSFYQDLAAKRLIYAEPIREEEPGGSILRVLKYYQSGYRIALDSFARVITRLMCGVNFADLTDYNGELINVEKAMRIIRGLLHEVDPNIDPDHIFDENI